MWTVIAHHIRVTAGYHDMPHMGRGDCMKFVLFHVTPKYVVTPAGLGMIIQPLLSW